MLIQPISNQGLSHGPPTDSPLSSIQPWISFQLIPYAGSLFKSLPFGWSLLESVLFLLLLQASFSQSWPAPLISSLLSHCSIVLFYSRQLLELPGRIDWN